MSSAFLLDRAAERVVPIRITISVLCSAGHAATSGARLQHAGHYAFEQCFAKPERVVPMSSIVSVLCSADDAAAFRAAADAWSGF